MKLGLFLLIGTSFVSSLAFLPALFSVENYLKSPECLQTANLNRACQKLGDVVFTTPVHHNVKDLEGSWMLLRPKDPDSTTYQSINYKNKFAITTTLFSNGTRVENIMPFYTCRRDETVHFTHAKQFTTYSDDSKLVKTLESNGTCTAQSFELVYASTSLRVDKMVTDGAFRVFVPCDNCFVRH